MGEGDLAVLLGSLKKLTTLRLGTSGTPKSEALAANLTDAGLQAVCSLPLSLTDLYLGFCKKLTDVGLESLRRLPLRALNFKSCDQFTNSSLEALQGLPLTSLGLLACGGDNHRLSDAGLGYLREMPLTGLDLFYSWGLTDAGLEHLRGMQLTDLDLGACYHLTSSSLRYLRGLPLKRLLSYGNTWPEGLFDKNLENLMKGMPLTCLDLADTDVSDADLVHLQVRASPCHFRPVT